MVLASNKADKPDPNAEREKVLGTLRAYSAAWWAVQDEMEAEEQRRINAKIVICRVCLPTASPEEHTASVRPWTTPIRTPQTREPIIWALARPSLTRKAQFCRVP
jgi:hypothetical protein